MKNHGMDCPPPQSQKEDKNPSESYHNHLPPFFEDFGGGVSTSNVPSYQWLSWQLRTVDPICFTQNFEQLLTKNLW